MSASLVREVAGVMAWVLEGLPGCTILRAEAEGHVCTIGTGSASRETATMFDNQEWRAMQSYDTPDLARWIERKKNPRAKWRLEESIYPTDSQHTVGRLLEILGGKLTGVKLIERRGA